MYEAAFKNIDNALRKDDGCATELGDTAQTSWILFLKYLKDFNIVREKSSQINNENHNIIIQEKFYEIKSRRWLSDIRFKNKVLPC